MSDDNKLLQFPCDFPIKVMGRDADGFESVVLEIFARHLDDMKNARVSSRPSNAGNFRSVTVTFQARDQAQLDALYRELSGHEQVLMCL